LARPALSQLGDVFGQQRARGRRQRIPGATTSAMPIATVAAASGIPSKRRRLAPSLRIGLGSMTWWATCLGGRKIAATTITMARRPMAQLDHRQQLQVSRRPRRFLGRLYGLPPLGVPLLALHRLPIRRPRLSAGADASYPLNLCHFVSWGFGGEAPNGFAWASRCHCSSSNASTT
jgi:hypothetical protein